MQALCFHGGLLTPTQNDARWKRRQQEMDRSIVAESARWGDARQAAPYTREGTWLPEMAWQETYWPQNHVNALARFQSVNLFPTIEAPSFNQHGGDISSGFLLTISAPTGSIYYTINGADPFTLDGNLAPTALAYTAAVPLTVDSRVKARVQIGAGGLSALTEAFFVIAVPASATNLVVSEIHYHPASGGVEFLELMNVSGQTIDLGGVRLTTAVDFTFALGTKLGAGQRVLITEDAGLFNTVYGPGLPVAGAYTGKLSNGGERLLVLAADGTQISRIDFSDALPWPKGADGFGPSLTLLQPQALPPANLASSWRLSASVGGTPGTGDATVFAGNPLADADHDGLNAFLEYALGTSDLRGDSGPHAVSLSNNGGYLEITCPRNLRADDVLLSPEFSADLQHWDTTSQPFQISAETFNPDGTSTVTWRSLNAVESARACVRIRAASR